jgi:hypothetical protein
MGAMGEESCSSSIGLTLTQALLRPTAVRGELLLQQRCQRWQWILNLRPPVMLSVPPGRCIAAQSPASALLLACPGSCWHGCYFFGGFFLGAAGLAAQVLAAGIRGGVAAGWNIPLKGAFRKYTTHMEAVHPWGAQFAAGLHAALLIYHHLWAVFPWRAV